MRNLLIKLLLQLLRIPPIEKAIDNKKMREWLGGQYPIKEFRDYISKRDLQILQLLGEGVSREEYLTYLGQRIELGMLLREAKRNFELTEAERRKKK
ncbi:MAG: hypothetical protein DDT23_01092 [candidate division WS2 bacterium]|nr:hypothetical protein [Candidatus Lithacetigena glycinireducens]